MASKAQAKELVERIAKDHGHLGEAVYARMDADTRRQVEEALLKKDEIIGSSVLTFVFRGHFLDARL